MGIRCRIQPEAIAAATFLATACGGAEAESTRLSLANGTPQMLRGITLVTGADTLTADTLRPGDTVSWEVRPAPAASFGLSWVEGTASRTIRPQLLDSVDRAREIALVILPGEMDLEVSYRF